MDVLDRTLFLKHRAPEIITVECPLLGGQVCLRQMTGKDRDSLEQWVLLNRVNDKMIPKNYRAMMIIRTFCDKDGELQLTEADIPNIMDLPAAALDEIFNHAARLNGMLDQEEIAGNSGAPTSGASGSTSRSTSAKRSKNSKRG